MWGAGLYVWVILKFPGVQGHSDHSWWRLPGVLRLGGREAISICPQCQVRGAQQQNTYQVRNFLVNTSFLNPDQKPKVVFFAFFQIYWLQGGDQGCCPSWQALCCRPHRRGQGEPDGHPAAEVPEEHSILGRHLLQGKHLDTIGSPSSKSPPRTADTASTPPVREAWRCSISERAKSARRSFPRWTSVSKCAFTDIEGRRRYFWRPCCLQWDQWVYSLLPQVSKPFSFTFLSLFSVAVRPSVPSDVRTGRSSPTSGCR